MLCFIYSFQHTQVAVIITSILYLFVCLAVLGLESPLDSKEIKPFNPKGNQPWIFIGRTDAEAEAPLLWPPDAKSRLIGKDPDAWKDWRQEEKGLTEAEIVGWHHWLYGFEFEQTPGDSEGEGSLVCCCSRGCKSRTQLSNWTTATLWSKFRRFALFLSKIPSPLAVTPHVHPLLANPKQWKICFLYLYIWLVWVIHMESYNILSFFIGNFIFKFLPCDNM